MQLKTAKKYHPWYWYMKLRGFECFMTFWGSVYAMPSWENNPGLIKSEMEHVRQLKEHGVIPYHTGYLHYNWVHGYWNNPFEVLARKAAGDTRTEEDWDGRDRIN
jgi:hypothetical protein